MTERTNRGMENTTLGQIRSFAIRTTRMSPAQKRGWDEYGDRYIVPFQDDPIDYDAHFPESSAQPGSSTSDSITVDGISFAATPSKNRTCKVKIDIGFGMGRELATLATEEPDTNFIGIEVHKPGIGRLLLDLGEGGVENVRIVPHDAVAVCRNMIPPGSVDGVHLFFPDPWPKARHAKRRLVRPGFPELIAPLLKPTGYLYMVTDWEEYAQQMVAILSASPLFRNRYDGERGFAPPQDWRPQTAFERKGLAKGHEIFELVYEPVVGNDR
jgi:tRNA (guanine-N7-)-methyltransferase